MHSFGFQYAFEKRAEADLRHFYTRCFGAATSVIRIMIETLAPSGFMLYSPDGEAYCTIYPRIPESDIGYVLIGHFVFTSFASAFLLKVSTRPIACETPALTVHSLKLLRPEFSWLVEPDDKAKIFDLIGRLIQTLNSPEVSIDNKHTPKLHAKFLAGLLTKHHQDSNQDPLSQGPLPPSKQAVGDNPTSHEGQPQPPSTSTQYFSQGQGTTQSTSIPQGGFGGVSYTSDPNLSSQPSTSYTHETPRYQPQASDGVAAAQDSAMNVMAGLSEEEMLATLRAIGNPNWWSNMMMPGYAGLPSTMVW